MAACAGVWLPHGSQYEVPGATAAACGEEGWWQSKEGKGGTRRTLLCGAVLV